MVPVWSTGLTGVSGALAFETSGAHSFAMGDAQSTTGRTILLRAVDSHGWTLKMLDVMSTM